MKSNQKNILKGGLVGRDFINSNRYSGRISKYFRLFRIILKISYQLLRFMLILMGKSILRATMILEKGKL